MKIKSFEFDLSIELKKKCMYVFVGIKESIYGDLVMDMWCTCTCF